MPLTLPKALRRALPHRLVEPLRRLVWRLPNLRRRLPSGLELTVEGPSDWTIYNDVFAEREYDEAIVAALDGSTGDPGDHPLTALDLGANVGYFTLRLADLALRRGVQIKVVAVEASPRLARQLARRLDQPLLAGRVQVVHGLAGRRGGHGLLYESPLHFEHSVVPRPGGRPIAVPYADLAALTAGWPAIDLLKIDVEGAEEEVLETWAADLLPRVRRAVVELHRGRCDVERCRALLAAAGLGPGRTLRDEHGAEVALFAHEAAP